MKRPDGQAGNELSRLLSRRFFALRHGGVLLGWWQPIGVFGLGEVGPRGGGRALKERAAFQSTIRGVHTMLR